MKTAQTQQPVRPQVLEEAAGWLVEFRAGAPDSTERRSFDEWLRASPEHVRAYLTLLPIWESDKFGELSDRPHADTLIQWARLPDDNIVPFSSSRARGHIPIPASVRAGRIATAASLLVAFGVAGYFAFSAWRNPVYATETGEQTTVTLPDGTMASLNSRTRIKLRFGEQERHIELQQGQALFQVAKEAKRPFIVTSDATQVRAVGTQFDIYKKQTGTVVTVVEGRVAVGAEQGEGTLLFAGEQLTLGRNMRTPKRVNVKAATAWTQRRLIFSATPLTDVAEEFNRYNTRQLRIDDDAELQALRINGVFSSADPTALLGFLREQPGITVTEGDEDIHVSRK